MGAPGDLSACCMLLNPTSPRHAPPLIHTADAQLYLLPAVATKCVPQHGCWPQNLKWSMGIENEDCEGM